MSAGTIRAPGPHKNRDRTSSARSRRPRRHHDCWPETEPASTRGVWMGAAVGIIGALWTFGFSFFRGDPAYWNYLWGDAGSGLAALRYYLDEPWGVPLLQAHALSTPDGINLAFTDSIPVLALIAKALRPLGIRPAQWWAGWYLFVFAAQGAAMAYAVRAWGARSAAIQVAAAVIALAGPIFLLRAWHPGLAGQFTLILAWAFVGKLRSGTTTPRLAFGILIAIIAMLTHVYLLVGAGVIIAGAVINEATAGRLGWMRATRWFAALTASIAIIAAVCGYFTAGATKASGYYQVGMHLFGPVIPQRSTFWPGQEWTISAGGSYDALNWVGFGWIGMVAAGFIASRHLIRPFIRTYQVLLSAVLVLAAYSITPVIRLWNDDDRHDLRTPLRWVYTDFDSHRYVYGTVAVLGAGLAAFVAYRRPRLRSRNAILFLSLPTVIWGASMLTNTVAVDAVTGQFRAAGRLFWVISYGALVLGATGLDRFARQLSKPAMTPIAVSTAAILLAVVQVVDTSAFRRQAGETLDPTPERVDRLDTLADLIDGYDVIHLEPALNCVTLLAGYDGIHSYQDVGIVASWELRPIDAAYAARRPDQSCAQPPTFIPDPSVVSVVVTHDITKEPTGGQSCTSVGLLAVCSP